MYTSARLSPQSSASEGALPETSETDISELGEEAMLVSPQWQGAGGKRTGSDRKQLVRFVPVEEGQTPNKVGRHITLPHCCKTHLMTMILL